MIDAQSPLARAFAYYRNVRIKEGNTFAAMPAQRALTKAREDVAAGRTRYPPQWRKVVTPAGAFPQTYAGWNPASPNGRRYVDSLAFAGLRFAGYADENEDGNAFSRPAADHKGWYTEDDGIDGRVLRGAALRLPAKRGRERFLAAYQGEDGDESRGFTVDMSWPAVVTSETVSRRYSATSYVTPQREAKKLGDAMAERDAERERDYNRAWQAGSQYAGELEAASDARKERRQVSRDLRDTCAAVAAAGVNVPESVRATLLSRLEGLAADVRGHVERARYWREGGEGGYGWRGDEVAAFNDGAGLAVVK